MNGFRKVYFTDENGYLFRDETGFTDAGLSIPMSVELGRNNCGTEQNKSFLSIQIDSEFARGGIIQYQLDGGDWNTLGQIAENIQTFAFKQRAELQSGRDINIRFVHNDYGDPPTFNGCTLYFTVIESIVNELGERL